MLAVQPACVPVPVVIVPRVLPVVAHHAAVPAVGGLVQLVVVTYLSESEKYASSAVTRLRRSDFMDAAYAFCLVLANFGIAIAARMPMITTTIKSSIRVKPLRFMLPPREVDDAESDPVPTSLLRNGRARSENSLFKSLIDI